MRKIALFCALLGLFLTGCDEDSTKPEDHSAGPLAGFTATAGSRYLELLWTCPEDPDVAGVRIRYATDDYPASPDSGLALPGGDDGRRGAQSNLPYSYIHSGLTNGMTYYYSAYVYNPDGEYSAAVQTSATPFDSVAPGPPTDFTATSAAGAIELAWVCPTDADVAKILVLYDLGGHPTHENGTPVPNGGEGYFLALPGSAGAFTHAVLDEENYYYSAFACDADSNYSEAVTAVGNAVQFLPNTSPENLLLNLEKAYDERILVAYDSLMATDFLFYFSEEDQQQFPESYDWQDEHAAHSRMFDPAWVQDLQLSFNIGELTLDEERTTVNDTVWTATVDQVDLYIYGKSPQHPNDPPQGWRMEDGIEIL